jgi:hypothetical protein
MGAERVRTRAEPATFGRSSAHWRAFAAAFMQNKHDDAVC